MTGLPTGWEWTSIGELAATSLGKMLDGKRATGRHPTPYLRNLNVRWGEFDLADIASMDIRPEELDRVLALPGDVIVCEGGEPGRAAVWRGPNPIAIQKALHRIRPRDAVLPDYLAYLLRYAAESGSLASLVTGSTIKHLPQEKLRLVRVPLAPIREQERIVVAIDEHLSRLDAAIAFLGHVHRRLPGLTAFPCEDLWRRGFHLCTLAELGTIVTGSTPSTKERRYWGGSFPFVTPGDLEPGGRVLVTERHLSADGRSVARELPPGTVLVTCIGATLGKAALAEVSLASNQQINGVIVDRTKADPKFVLAMLASPSGQRRLWEASSTTTIPLLNKSRFGRIQVPLPPPHEQHSVVEGLARSREVADRLANDVERATLRAASLRRSILSAAFKGKLVPQDPSDEPVTVLVERLRGERSVNARKSAAAS